MNDENFKLLLNSIENLRSDINKRFDANDKQHTSINNAITMIEHDHGEKLDALWDAFVGNEQKHNLYENKLDEHDEKLYNHDLKIEVLEEKIS